MNSTIQLHQKALWANISSLGSLHPRGTEGVCVVLKSNAYGHGLETTWKAFENRKIHSIGVAYVEEAQLLRKAGYKGRILMLAPAFEDQFPECQQLGLEVFLSSEEQIQRFDELTQKSNALASLKVHLKFDTGLGRQGILRVAIPSLLPTLLRIKNSVVGVCSHFANVEDVEEQEFAQKQLSEFLAIRKDLDSSLTTVEWHIASSAAHILMPEARMDFVRVGISTYGIWPSKVTKTSRAQIDPKKQLTLTPCLSMTTRIHAVKRILKGSYVGYGCTFKAPKDMVIASLPLGYYEGILRLAGQRGAYVLVEGSRCKVVGTISMNIIMIDVTDLPSATAGQEVVLIGRSGDEALTVEQWADWCSTIPYEFVSRLHPQISREAKSYNSSSSALD